MRRGRSPVSGLIWRLKMGKKISRQDSLPFPREPSGSTAGRTMQESVYKPSPKPRHLPDDAPNILIILIDDAGPGLPTTFGGEVHTRAMDRIVSEGIAYNRFPELNALGAVMIIITVALPLIAGALARRFARGQGG
jgi:hypothetical protein